MKKIHYEKLKGQAFFYAYDENGFGEITLEKDNENVYTVNLGDTKLTINPKEIKDFYYELTEDRKCIRFTCETIEDVELTKIKNHFDSCNIGEDSDVYYLK